MTKNEALIRAEEINKLAFNRPEMPDDLLCQAERMLFLSLRSLYYQFNTKFITREQAVREKASLIEHYLDVQMWESIFHSDMKINVAICKLTAPLGSKIAEMTEQEAKDTLHKVIALYDGRMSPEEV